MLYFIKMSNRNAAKGCVSGFKHKGGVMFLCEEHKVDMRDNVACVKSVRKCLYDILSVS
jgi:hypothetical protein